MAMLTVVWSELVLDLSDFVETELNGSRRWLEKRATAELFPVRTYIEFEAGDLFETSGVEISVPERDWSAAFDVETRSVTLDVYMEFEHPTKKPCTAKAIDEWQTQTGGFGPPVFDFAIGDFQSCNGGDVWIDEEEEEAADNDG